MTFTETRKDLAVALGTIPKVRGYVHRPTTPEIGDAWPLFGGAGNRAGDTFEGRWRVLVFVGGDEVTATEWMDEHLPAVLEAIDPIAYVDSAIPRTTTINGAEAFVIEITARSE